MVGRHTDGLRDRNESSRIVCPYNERLYQLRCREVLSRVNLHSMTNELTDIDGQMPVERALAGGEPQRVGWFRFYFADERWEWSPQVQRMHG